MFGRNARFLSKGHHRRFVVGEVIEHAGKEARFARGVANTGGPNSGCGQKAAESNGIGREEGKRTNGHSFGLSALQTRLVNHRFAFAFP